MHHRIIAATLAAGLAVSALAGCTNQGAADSADGTVELTFWTHVNGPQ